MSTSNQESKEERLQYMGESLAKAQLLGEFLRSICKGPAQAGAVLAMLTAATASLSYSDVSYEETLETMFNGTRKIGENGGRELAELIFGVKADNQQAARKDSDPAPPKRKMN